MNELKHKMIRQAVERYSAIFPLMSRKDLRDCFTTEGNMLLFWFNTADESTHVLKVSLS